MPTPLIKKVKSKPKGDATMLEDLELVDGTENEGGEVDDLDDEMADLYPEEFRLFRMGDNVAYTVGKGYSVVKYDNVSGAKVMAAYAEHGMDLLPIDHEHQTFNAPMNGQVAPAHGWFLPEHRNNDGLYATKVQF